MLPPESSSLRVMSDGWLKFLGMDDVIYVDIVAELVAIGERVVMQPSDACFG